jgi:ferredoxin
LGGLFYLWVHGIESGRRIAGVARPPGVEGWLPIAGLMNLKYLLVSRSVPGVHPAAMFLLLSVKSAECTGCMECVAVCPAQDALWAGFSGLPGCSKPRLPAWALAAGIALLFFSIIAYAEITGCWNGDIPAQVYTSLVPHADQAPHPMSGDPALGH